MEVIFCFIWKGAVFNVQIIQNVIAETKKK